MLKRKRTQVTAPPVSFRQRAQQLIKRAKLAPPPAATAAADDDTALHDEKSEAKPRAKSSSSPSPPPPSANGGGKPRAKSAKSAAAATVFTSANLFQSLVTASDSDDDHAAPVIKSAATTSSSSSTSTVTDTNTDDGLTLSLWTTETRSPHTQSQSQQHPLFDSESQRKDEMIYRLIDTQSQLKSAITAISQHSLISVDCEGVSLGRDGTLCLIQVGVRGTSIPSKAQFGSHRYQVYLFDLCCLGRSVFDAGLGAILNDSKVKKLFYDCRRDCDALYHHYNVNVRGIIDCQLLEVNSRRSLSEPCHSLPGLAKVIAKHLPDAHSTLLAIKSSMNSRYADEPKLWEQRPMSGDLLLYASQDVACLFMLYSRQLHTINSSTVHASSFNAPNEVHAFADRVWSRTFIDGTESTKEARAPPQSDEERELMRRRVCAAPDVANIRESAAQQTGR